MEVTNPGGGGPDVPRGWDRSVPLCIKTNLQLSCQFVAYVTLTCYTNSVKRNRKNVRLRMLSTEP